MPLLQPDEKRTLKAWRQLVATGELRADLLRPHITRAWRRCQVQGVSPRCLTATTLPPAEIAELIDHNRDMIEAARPYMQALARYGAACGKRHAAILGDRRGVVLSVVGDEHTLHGPQPVPVPGSLLTERVAGANSIGSPLAEHEYVELVGSEHFIEGLHNLTGQGLPLRGPEGEVVGALSLCVRRVQAAERVHEILVCAAHGVEAELMRRRLQDEVRRVLRGDPDVEQPLEPLRQDIDRLQAAARLRLEQATRVLADGQQGAGRHLVQLADELIRRFRRSSARWREIAEVPMAGGRTLQRVALDERVRELVELLQTEAAGPGGRLVLGPLASIELVADARALSRLLLRGLLRALRDVDPGAGEPPQLTLTLRLLGDGTPEVALAMPGEAERIIPLTDALVTDRAG